MGAATATADQPQTMTARHTGVLDRAPALDNEAVELLEVFTYVQQKINDHLNVMFAADHLSLAHYRALFFVLRYPGISVSGLIDKLDITKQSLARVLADLIRGRAPVEGEGKSMDMDDADPGAEQLISEVDGYLYSEVDPADRRARKLYLTERGELLMRHALAPIATMLRSSFSRIDQEG